ncbi:1-phosphatidylinositol-3-phosphate 5-kinase FAB1B [Solanum lycopersicum]|uniref:1-phosphatidylinositol-3-phosphate 5-kinase n=1 Tax=Solanum lycopersicum TaxID=4081 RepID=A0A3Q7H924_SOLLC|nr:1-phosphatidylinositol-3-phosphate 5-kinase FAB1B [Solanum lycopersicum]XP_010323386.1 1-phosphatidylinositol-3-phosphate 5-kinase FAB1B [Solanum lycopersicum]
MDTPENKKLSEIVDVVKLWMPRKTEAQVSVSRDFWMPDQSCRVCYECDSQFTVFNRRHHCRLCGRVFCAKCASNSIPVSNEEPKAGQEDGDRIRVCSFCFKKWQQGLATVDSRMNLPCPGLSPSPSTTSLASSQSGCTCNSGSSGSSTVYPTGPYQYVPCSSCQSASQSAQLGQAALQQDQATSMGNPEFSHFISCYRSDDEDDDYGVCGSHSEPRHFTATDVYYGAFNYKEMNDICGPNNGQPAEIESSSVNSSSLTENCEWKNSEGMKELAKEIDSCINRVEHEEPPPYDVNDTDNAPVDFESSYLLWLPPEPETEEDDRESLSFDEDDDCSEEAPGEWGYMDSSWNLADGEYHNRSTAEHRKAMKNVVDGHFKSLIVQLLQVEHIPPAEEDNSESWSEIVTSLSWEAATLLKPDMSQNGGMDPCGYVKIKCIASGHRRESMVVKGVVCKKNVAHRRMNSKFKKPRLLILGGALEYQRVANHLSSFDTLLQQEMDHLKMAVAKIDAHHPNILLVEKSVSRFAQEYLLVKNISLVLNVKRPLLERIARCTGAQVVPSIDNLTTPKLGYCDSFHVDKFVEEHGSAGQAGKKLTKTLMFFEGCPKPFGCTILLKGANGDDLKKIKRVIQYGVFAAYHLALETSFLADEGASLPELPLKSPLKVALPDKPSTMQRSISVIPGFSVPVAQRPHDHHSPGTPSHSSTKPLSGITSPSNSAPMLVEQSSFPECYNSLPSATTASNNVDFSDCPNSSHHSRRQFSDQADGRNEMAPNDPHEASPLDRGEDARNDYILNFPSNSLRDTGSFSHVVGGFRTVHLSSELVLPEFDNSYFEELGSLQQDYPSSPSDQLIIVVCLSTRCVWKGTVCEPPHISRIKFYGITDMPLGRFLRDRLFDENFRCPSCEMPPEAHVRCYTHRQGSLTISVKKLPECILPGEQEGKIWMWHRCLRCPRDNGFPPPTRRVVMSNAAWGLSFGKFLELSFSNHAAASRVASCGHLLHRDCLRFYGFGKMVACFRYAPVHVYSVFLPPPKLEFSYDNQEWIQKEGDEVRRRANALFAEVSKVLHVKLEKFSVDSSLKAPKTSEQITEMEEILEKEKTEFEGLLRKALSREIKVGQPTVDILEINQLRRQLVFHAYLWDRRLIHLSSSHGKNSRTPGSLTQLKEKPLSSSEELPERTAILRPGKSLGSYDSALQNVKTEITSSEGRHGQIPDGVHERLTTDENLTHGKDCEIFCAIRNTGDGNVLEPGKNVRRVLSDAKFPSVGSLSDTLDAAWTGESHLAIKEHNSAFPGSFVVDSTALTGVSANTDVERSLCDKNGAEIPHLSAKSDNTDYLTWATAHFSNFYRSFNKNITANPQYVAKLNEHNPVYILSFSELLHQGGARLLTAVGENDIVIPVYDDEPTSIISYALVSPDYRNQMSDESQNLKENHKFSASLSFLDSLNLLPLHSVDGVVSESPRSFGSTNESMSSGYSSRSSNMDPPAYINALHARISFSDDGPPGKVKYTVTCYYAKQFETLRKSCCPNESDFIRSLSRCKKWGAQGGKSNVFFAKTLDDRFIIKQVTKTELESFIKFAPAYFKYLSDSIASGSPTCLAKILGIYQVTSKHLKGGKESRMDVLVMENLLFKRNITRLYDLKGSSRSRYNPDSSGSNKVLLDQNLIEAMPTSPIFVGTQAKRLLQRAVWNDTSFLASIDVMDYSLLVGVDEKKQELVLGIIDFMRQYTWDKHLETWVKASGILGGPKNAAPTVISPKQYKIRFRKAMSTYFLMVPDEWPT